MAWAAMAGFVAGQGTSLLSEGISAFTTPKIREIQHGAWFMNPTNLMSTQEAIALYVHNLIPRKALDTLCAANGINMTGETKGDSGKQTSQAHLKLVELARDYPNVNYWIQLFLRGWLRDEGDLKKHLDRAGTDFTYWQPYLEAARPQLPPGELQVARNRGWIDKFDYDRTLQRFHGLDAPTRKLVDKLRQWIPTPGDLIRFSVREAFNQDQVDKLGLDQEFDQNPEFQKWMQAQGAGIVEARGESGALEPMNVPKMFWRAHWDLPSPTAAYTMLQRLRPTGGRGGGPRSPTGLVMVQGEPQGDQLSLSSLLKAADYAPKWRDPLAAISYLQLGRREIASAYQFDVFGPKGKWAGGRVAPGPAEKEVYELYQDMGLSPQAANDSTQILATRFHRDEVKPAYAIVRKNTLAAYRLGILEDQQFIDALVSIEIAPETAATELAVVKYELAIRRGKAGISAIRHGFLSGAIGWEELPDLFDGAGVPKTRQGELSATWRLELQGQRKEIAAKQVIDYLTRGLLDVVEADRRLTNLGYNRGARGLMLAQSAQDLGRIIERERLTQIRDAKARAREMMALARQARQEEERLRKLAAGSATKADILRWVGKGWITREQAYNRLIQLKFLPDDANRLIDEATSE